MNPFSRHIVRTVPMAACAKVQFDIIAELQRQRSQLAKWDLEAKFRELQEMHKKVQVKDYTSRSLKLALERHQRK